MFIRVAGPGAGVGPLLLVHVAKLVWLLEANGPQGIPPAEEWALGGEARTF